MSFFVGMRVSLTSGAEGARATITMLRGLIQLGVITGTFGKSGKFKVNFPQGFQCEDATKQRLHLHLRRYVFDANKKYHQ